MRRASQNPWRKPRANHIFHTFKSFTKSMRTKPVAHHNFHEKRFTKFMRREPRAHHNLHKKSFPKIPKFMRRKARAHHNFHEKSFTKSMRRKNSAGVFIGTEHDVWTCGDGKPFVRSLILDVALSLSLGLALLLLPSWSTWRCLCKWYAFLFLWALQSSSATNLVRTTIDRGNACLKSELVVESWEVLSLSLSLSLSDEGEPQAVYDKLSRNRCYKFAKRMIDGSIYRSIDRSIGDRLVVARFSIFEAMHESSYMNPLSNARDAFRYCKQHVVSWGCNHRTRWCISSDCICTPSRSSWDSSIQLYQSLSLQQQSGNQPTMELQILFFEKLQRGSEWDRHN